MSSPVPLVELQLERKARLDRLRHPCHAPSVRIKVAIPLLFACVLTFPLRHTLAEPASREVAFTQEDRDRIIRLEIRLEEGQKSLQQQINDLKQQIAEVKSFMLWGFGILFAGMFALVGFVIWDRRTAVAPVQRRQGELEEDQAAIKKALREYAKKEPRLAEVLRSLNLM